ncbi:MAG: translocation/assembly module TamB domain-containing protein [Panacagrimonas sp.]
MTATVLGVLLSGAVVGALVFVAWLLATTSGARWLLEWLPRAGLAQVTAEQVEGRLLGPLGVRDLRYVEDGVEVRLDRATLYWSPAALLYLKVQIDDLQLGSLEVDITEPNSPKESKPFRIPQLPVSIALHRLQLDRLSLRLPGSEAPQVVERVAGDELKWSISRLQIKKLALHQPDFGTFESTLDAGLSATGMDVYTLLVMEKRDQGVQLSASGVLDLDQGESSVVALEWHDLRWPLLDEPSLFSRKGKLTLEGTLAAFEAQGELALGDTAQIKADARYSPEHLEAKLQWTALQWPLSGAPRIASSRGQLDASGTPRDYRYTLDAELAAEGQKGVATATGSGGLSHVVLEQLKLAVAKSAIDGKADVRWSPEFEVDADLVVKNLDPGLIDSAWPGKLNGTLKAQTQVQGDTPLTQFEVSLKNSSLRGYPLALDTKGSSEGAVVVFDSLRLRSAATQLQGRGQVTPPFDLSAELDSPDLAALWPGLAGRAKLQATLKGDIKTPHVTAGGSVSELKFEQWTLDQLRLKADVALAGAWMLDVDVDGLAGPAEVKRARVEVTGRDTDHEIRLSLESPQAIAALGARGAFDHRRQSWKGNVQTGRVAPADLAEWTLQEPAALRLDATQVQLEPMCWQATTSRVCARLQREDARLRAAFRLEQFDFAYFAAFLPPGWELRGGIDGTGLVELLDGELKEVSADLSTDPSEVLRDGEVLLKAERGSLLVKESGGRAVAKLDLPIQGGSIAFDGELGATGSAPADLDARPLSAQLDVQLDDLGFLRLVTEEIEQVSGKLQGRMNWTGSLLAPQATGNIALTGGRLRLATPGIEMQDIGMRVESGADGLLKISGAATSDSGTLSLDGNANLAGDPRSARLTLRGEMFRAADMTEARIWISPRMDITMEGDRIDVRGEIDVPRADITPVSFEGGVAPSSDQVIVTQEGAPEARGIMQVSADVKLNLGDRVHFKGLGLTTKLAGSVRAIEQPGRPGSGRGEVRLIEGSYKAYGQELQIETGRLLFNGGPLTEPAIEIRALRKPREDIEVGVLVRGTLDKPLFDLYSTPAMPRERQLSWLVLGRSLDEGSGDGDQALLASAALSLGLSGTDYLAQNLRNKVGVDDISIGAQPGEDAQLARFTVGKYLSPKLYVSYGVGIFQPGQFFRLLYELGRGFKVSTESGVHTGGDLLYSVERP